LVGTPDFDEECFIDATRIVNDQLPFTLPKNPGSPGNSSRNYQGNGQDKAGKSLQDQPSGCGAP
jgi:hypothetical protein